MRDRRVIHKYHPVVAAAAAALTKVHAADDIIGIPVHDRIKTAGPAVTGAINIVLPVWLSQYSRRLHKQF